MLTVVNESMLPKSTSVSLAITSMLVVAESSETVAVSAIASGASFTGVTVTVNVPVAVSVPSDTV